MNYREKALFVALTDMVDDVRCTCWPQRNKGLDVQCSWCRARVVLNTFAELESVDCCERPETESPGASRGGTPTGTPSRSGLSQCSTDYERWMDPIRPHQELEKMAIKNPLGTAVGVIVVTAAITALAVGVYLFFAL